MYNKHILKCKECGDEITIEYDSRNEPKSKWVRCKCGKLEAMEGCIGFKYKNDYGEIYEIIKNEYNNTIDDYFILDDYLENKFKIITDLAKELGFELREYKDNDTNQYWSRTLEYIYFNNQNECLNITFELDLKEIVNPYTDEDRMNKYKEIDERLEDFNKFLLKAKENPEILKNEEYLWNTTEYKYLDGNREQKKLYDYDIYF